MRFRIKMAIKIQTFLYKAAQIEHSRYVHTRCGRRPWTKYHMERRRHNQGTAQCARTTWPVRKRSRIILPIALRASIVYILQAFVIIRVLEVLVPTRAKEQRVHPHQRVTSKDICFRHGCFLTFFFLNQASVVEVTRT